MMRKNLRQVWEQLRAEYASRRNKLTRLRVQGLRGIRDLEVAFPYPVSVLAGPNACGKSTVLFALGCAYRPPEAGPRDFVPSTLFPDFKTDQAGIPRDSSGTVEIEFQYVVGGRSTHMRWRRETTSWNRSGPAARTLPARQIYLRTLANLSNPSEVRSLLQMGRHTLEKRDVDAADITLAHRILPWRYDGVMRIRRSNKKELLFVSRDGAGYSEFHMSSGERSVLRLSLEIARLRDALVLIDEVEAGLHPFTQEVLMLELQRLALRNKLQVVVASHSPVVLDCVPVEARIFLERQADNVVVRPPHHDVVQRAFYGRTLERLTVLCEDSAAEAIVRGIFDHLAPELGMLQSDVEIGHDTGKDEFKHHVAAFARFEKLWSTVFVLDGDARDAVPDLEAVASRHGQALNAVCLPGRAAPEEWAWSVVAEHPGDYAGVLGLEEHELQVLLERIEQTYAGAVDKESNKAKGRIWALADATRLTVPQLLRRVGRREAERGSGSIVEALDALRDAVARWRNQRGDA